MLSRGPDDGSSRETREGADVMEQHVHEPFAIRPAGPEDVGIILDLIRGIAEYERLADEVVADERVLREHLFPEPPLPIRAECLIGEIDGHPVAFALFFHNFSTFLGRPGLYLEDVFVRPEHRRRGLGRALVRRLARIAMERGCGRMEWAVLNWNEPAIGFYRRLGAQPLDGWTTYRLTESGIAALAGGGP